MQSFRCRRCHNYFAHAFNELNASMGKPAAYPFALAPRVVEKLHFVHKLTADARRNS